MNVSESTTSGSTSSTATPTTLNAQPLSPSTNLAAQFLAFGGLALVALLFVAIALYWIFFRRSFKKRRADLEKCSKKDVHVVSLWTGGYTRHPLEDAKNSRLNESHAYRRSKSQIGNAVANESDWDVMTRVEEEVHLPPKAVGFNHVRKCVSFAQ